MITVTKMPPVVALSDNPMLFEFTSDDLPAGASNNYIEVQPWYNAPSDLLGTEVVHLPAIGTGYVELSEYLRSGLFAPKRFLFPEVIPVPWNPRNRIRSYQLNIKEVYTLAGSQVEVNTELQNRRVIRGKIPRWKRAAFYASYTSFFNWVSTTKSFLTLSPKTLVTRTNQMQKLYFLVYWTPSVGETLTLKVDVSFTDGSKHTYTPAQSTPELAYTQVIEFPVGYAALDLKSWAATNHAGKKIAAYQVTAMSSATAVSESRMYILDNRGKNGIQFVFSNSVGGYDTLMATGVNELSSDYEFENVDQQSPGVQNLPEKVQMSVTDKIVRTCRTGYFNTEIAEYIAEFFESDERYEISGSTLIPIVLRNAKILRKKDNEHLFFAEFDCEHALHQKVEIE